MTNLVNPTTSQPQQRLRCLVKQLVIDHGYLERYLEEFGDDNKDKHLQRAATSLNTVIDSLNSHLEEKSCRS